MAGADSLARGRRPEQAAGQSAGSSPLDDHEKSSSEIASSNVPADQTLQGAQVGALLEPLIAGLPEKLRQPLILSAIEEMSPAEVAATLGSVDDPASDREFQLEVTANKVR
jgi:DNA-directed RNA polymerase specialized sigma24 family protein